MARFARGYAVTVLLPAMEVLKALGFGDSLLASINPPV